MQGKTRRIVLATSVFLIVFGLIIALFIVDSPSKQVVNKPDVFVGVEVAYGDENAVYTVANAVLGYANLIVLGSLKVTQDTEALTRVCNFLFQKGFYFIIYVGFANNGFVPPRGPDARFFDMAAEKYGDKLLGGYFFDEVGGKQIDKVEQPVDYARNNGDAAIKFVCAVGYPLTRTTGYYSPCQITRFTSDYALYWYDYVAGYNVVFTEFVGNQSREIAVALCRGAAKTMNQSWGTIITWKYGQPPFLEDATELYNDMVLAYQNGAKYIVVFDSPDEADAITEYGILTTDHLDAMKNFWDYTKTNRQPAEFQAKTAYVLPRDYGFGFRSPNDTLWGLWNPDSLSPKIWNDTTSLLAQYGPNVDIIYETVIDNEPTTLPYDKLIFWNGTVVQR